MSWWMAVFLVAGISFFLVAGISLLVVGAFFVDRDAGHALGDELAELAEAATPCAMGGTPDLFAPKCTYHGRSCDDPWDCYEQRVKVVTERRRRCRACESGGPGG